MLINLEYILSKATVRTWAKNSSLPQSMASSPNFFTIIWWKIFLPYSICKMILCNMSCFISKNAFCWQQIHPKKQTENHYIIGISLPVMHSSYTWRLRSHISLLLICHIHFKVHEKDQYSLCSSSVCLPLLRKAIVWYPCMNCKTSRTASTSMLWNRWKVKLTDPGILTYGVVLYCNVHMLLLHLLMPLQC